MMKDIFKLFVSIALLIIYIFVGIEISTLLINLPITFMNLIGVIVTAAFVWGLLWIMTVIYKQIKDIINKF